MSAIRPQRIISSLRDSASSILQSVKAFSPAEEEKEDDGGVEELENMLETELLEILVAKLASSTAGCAMLSIGSWSCILERCVGGGSMMTLLRRVLTHTRKDEQPGSPGNSQRARLGRLRRAVAVPRWAPLHGEHLPLIHLISGRPVAMLRTP